MLNMQGLNSDEHHEQFQFIGRFDDRLRASHITRTHDILDVLLHPDQLFDLPTEQRVLDDADPEYTKDHFDRLDEYAKEFYERIVRSAIHKYGPEILPDGYGAING